MEKNVGSTDKIIRYVIGIALLIGGIMTFTGGNSVLGGVLLLLAIISIGTATTGFCLLYKVFGINTCKVKTS